MSDELLILYQIQLYPKYKPTGETRHFVHGSLVTEFGSLQIGKYESDPGYYLLYFDKNSKWLTDTYHDTVEGAMDQAEFEFKVKPKEWEQVSKNDESR